MLGGFLVVLGEENEVPRFVLSCWNIAGYMTSLLERILIILTRGEVY